MRVFCCQAPPLRRHGFLTIARSICALHLALLVGCGVKTNNESVIVNSDALAIADLSEVSDATRPLGNPFDEPPLLEHHRVNVASLDPAETLLDESRQREIWDAEHITHMLEWRFGKGFRETLFSTATRDVTSHLSREMRATTLEISVGAETVHGCISERTGDRTSVPTEAQDASGLGKWLLELTDGFESISASSFRVLFIKPTSTTTETELRDWQARVLLSCRGSGTDKPFREMSSEHTIRLRWKDDKSLYADPVVVAWRVENFVIRESDSQLMREITEEAGFNQLALPDNWSDDTANMLNMQLAVEDLDRDGYLDIVLATGAGQQYFLRSIDGKRFEIATRFPAQVKTPYGSDFSVGILDFDRDGFADVLIGRRLYKNHAGKRFEHVTSSTKLEFAPSVLMGYSIVDFDLDGYDDIYCNYSLKFDSSHAKKTPWIGDAESGASNQMWRNRGDGTFEEVSEKAGVTGGRRQTFASLWLHANEDALPDLYVANDFSSNQLLLNGGRGTFIDVSLNSGAADFATSMGATSGDFDNDGIPELYVANMYSKMGRRIVAQVEPDDYPPGVFEHIHGACAGNRFYQRKTNETEYVERSMDLGINDVGWAYAPAAFDADNDGNLDLYSTTGFLSFDRTKPDG